MPRINSSDWSVNDPITAVRLQDFNEDIDDIYTLGTDRGRIRTAISGTPLMIDIAAFAWRVGSTSGQYAGATDIAVSDSATNYVEIDATGTIAINTTSWTTNNARLGTVTCAGGVVTAISIWKPDVMGGDLATSTLVNVETLAGNKTITSTDEYYELLDPDGTNRTVTLETTNMSEGQSFYIKNTGTSGSLEVKQSSTSLLYIPSGHFAIFTFDGTNWKTLYNRTDAGFFGDGSDGDVTISSPTSLTRDMYYNNLTVNSTLDPKGFRIFVKNVLDGTGTINSNGGAGTNGSSSTTNSGASGGAGGTAAHTGGYLPDALAGVTGGSGGTGSSDVGTGAGGAGATSAGNAASNSIGGNGAAGATGGAGGTTNGSFGSGTGGTSTGGTATALAATAGGTKQATTAVLWRVFGGSSVISYTGNAGAGGGGGGGGGGAQGGTSSTNAGGGGGGGGGGGNGGNILVAARIIRGSFNITATGGVGGNGGNGANAQAGTNTGGGGGGAGAAGGSGGVVTIISNDSIGWTGTATAAGGAAGTGGTGGSPNGTGTSGSTGSTGTTGTTGIIRTFTL
tara:strand:- start:1402 stop:3099 length:1698 start_codon:yes stop_codon:yes gene_type:complete